MAFHLLSLALAGILSFADYVTENIYSKKIKENLKFISFSAGVAISYIVLNLFPEISSNALIEGKTIFLYALLGFLSLNLVEQYVHKGTKKSNMVHYHKSLHVAYFFLYNLFIGMILVNFSSRGFAPSRVFFLTGAIIWRNSRNCLFGLYQACYRQISAFCHRHLALQRD